VNQQPVHKRLTGAPAKLPFELARGFG